MNIFVFDIETVPDVAAGRQIYNLIGLNDSDVGEAMLTLKRQTSGTEFLPLHLHRIVAISVVLRRQDQLTVWSLGDEESDEAEILTRFYHGIDKFTPTLVSWNGSGFDLPVLHYRSLIHGVNASRYWEVGEEDPAFRWNNYINRYHYRHLDLMDVLAGYQARANAPLDHIATLLGYPGKMGMSGAKVWGAYQQGQIKQIRDYCETDVLNTYLVYLHFEKMRGHLSAEEFQQEISKVKQLLSSSDQDHLQQFLNHWQSSNP